MSGEPAPFNDEWLTIRTDDGPMKIYRVWPPDTARPTAAVLVLQEAFGVNQHIQDVTRRVAAHGYLALAPELFHRSVGGTVDYADRDTAMALINNLGPTAIGNDIRAVLDHLKSTSGLPVHRVATVGFCFGGRAAVTAATALPGLAATVAFYGPGVVDGPHAVLESFDAITGPVLMLLGDQDPTIPPEHVTALRAAANQAQLDLRVSVFPDAGHAFHCDARPAAYNRAAAEKAWKLTTTFLAEVFDEESSPRPAAS